MVGRSNAAAQDVFNDQLTDDQLKEHLHRKIIGKNSANELLDSLKANKITFDKLWNEKSHSVVRDATIVLY